MIATSRPEVPVKPDEPARYRRFTWQEALVNYLPAHRQTPLAFKWVERLPTIFILLLMSLLALRLRNSAFIDEALYVNAGQDYLNHFLHGAPTPNHGDFFSGAPGVYPVLAAALDSVGGLFLVRLFSLLCVMVTVVAVQDTAQALFKSRRIGLLAGATFALTGSVVFVGALGTFDSLCVLSLAVALWLGVKKTGVISAVGIGLALTLAVTVKYTGFVFVPVILGIIVLTGRRQILRVVIAIVSATWILVPVLLVFGDGLIPGIKFTTSARVALSPTTTTQLTVYLLLNIGVLALLAFVGAARMARGWQKTLIVLGLLGAAAMLPLAQMRLGEAVSFDKHTAYSALFLAPLAGAGLAAMSRGLLKLAPVCLLMLVVLVFGASRSGSLYAGWVDVRPVVKIIDKDPKPGLYISSSTDALKYYTRKTHPEVRWQTTFSLYPQGEAAIRAAVDSNRYQMIILRSASTGSGTQDAGQRILEEAIKENPDYVLAVKPFDVQKYSDDQWFVYRLDPVVPPTAYKSDSTPAQSSTTEKPATTPVVDPAPVRSTSTVGGAAKPAKPATRPGPAGKTAATSGFCCSGGRALTPKEVSEIRAAGHDNQHATMRKYSISHELLHRILGTPVKPF